MFRRILNRFGSPKKSARYPWLLEESEQRMDNILTEIDSNPNLVWESPDGFALSSRLLSEFNQVQFSKINMKPFSTDRIGYVPLLESNNYTLAIFYLPRNYYLPFHNHPNQTVFQRVIHGDIIVESCDIQKGASASTSVPSTLITKNTVTPKELTTLVSPSKDNIHRISTESEQALFVDLVVPPYNNSSHPISYFEHSGSAGLRPIQDPHVPMDWIPANRVFIEN